MSEFASFASAASPHGAFRGHRPGALQARAKTFGNHTEQGGVFVVVFVWKCFCGGVFVVVLLWRCFCGGVCVVVFLWWCL